MGVCALFASTLACAPARPDRVLYDLLDHAERAAVRVETSRIDIGKPRARAHLIDGWNPGDERWGGITSFVWGVGNGSSARFWLFEPKETVTLAFRCRPHAEAAGDTVERIVVWFNRVRVGEVGIVPGFHEYRLRLLPELQLAGENELEFDYLERPPGVFDFAGSGNSAQLRVAWDSIRIEEGRGFLLPRVESTGVRPALLIPHYSRISFAVRVPPGSRLEARAVESFGPAWKSEPGILRVTVHTAGASEAVGSLEFTGDRLGGPLRWPLPVSGEVTLSIESLLQRPQVTPQEVERRAAAESDAGIMLVRPRIVAGDDDARP